jgi:energy-coupling factor transporter ATP-binding protein EcfA2
VIPPTVTNTDGPFPGLRPFLRDEADLFFGREAVIEKMVERLAAHHFLAVIGASGSGKSSLVNAGLISALERGRLREAGNDWRIAPFRPGSRPITMLAAALQSVVLNDWNETYVEMLEAALNRDSFSIADWLAETDLPRQTNLLLLVDQFEEMLIFLDEARGVDSFLKLILAHTNQKKARIYTVITMRAEFIGKCTEFPVLTNAINEGQFLIPRMTPDQYQQVIERPAAIFGAQVEKPLVEKLIDDFKSADRLPLMQHALRRIWSVTTAGAESEKLVLKLSDYERIGGSNALASQADETFATLTTSEQEIAACMFRALTAWVENIGGAVRRPARLGDIIGISGAASEELVRIADAFRAPDRKLLLPPIDFPLSDHTILDISHESLIRQWPKLERWARQEFESAQMYQKVLHAAHLWQSGGGTLWKGPDLAIALAWRDMARPTVAWAMPYGGDFHIAMDFLDRSKKKSHRWWETFRLRDSSIPAARSDHRVAASRVFVSHSSRDQSSAMRIVSQLEKADFPCWISSRDVPHGEPHQRAIVKALKAARAMVLVFSKNANSSEEIVKELSLASKNKLFILPVRIEDCEPTDDFEYELAARQRIDLFRDWEQNMKLIVRALHKQREVAGR